MKQNNFSGIVLLGLGLFFLVGRLNVVILQPYLTWPTLLIIIGIALLFQAGAGKDPTALFTGIFLVGLGLHFHAASRLESWPDHLQMVTLLTGVSFLFQYKKGKNGLVPGLLLTVLSVWFIFFNSNTQSVQYLFADVKNFWPFILMIFGAYLLFFKKK
jgi:hypothetical protein